MYQITRTYRRTDRQKGRWEAFPLASEPVTTLTSIHGDVWVFLTYPMLQGEEIALRFDKVRNLVNDVSPTTTLQEWLTSLGNLTLPVETELPEFKERFVTYASAWHSGYEVKAVGRGAGIDQNASKHQKEDLFITKEGVSPEYLRKHAMISVNGFFHITEYDVNGVYVREGNNSVRLANENQVGIHSFADVGEINYVPITEAMITPKREGTPLREGCYITLPGTIDLTGKTALLVAGGYLQVMDRTYQRVGDRTWRIHLGRLSLVERYYDSKDWIDLSALNFTEYENNPSLISLNEMFRDETITAYLTLPQSFIVLVSTDNLFQEYLPIEHAGVPGRWLEYQFEQYPAIGAYGRALEYHPTQEGEITVINGTESKMHAYDFHTRPWRKKPGIDGSRYPAKPFEHTRAFWRVLGTVR